MEEVGFGRKLLRDIPKPPWKIGGLLLSRNGWVVLELSSFIFVFEFMGNNRSVSPSKVNLGNFLKGCS